MNIRNGFDIKSLIFVASLLAASNVAAQQAEEQWVFDVGFGIDFSVTAT